MDPRNNNKFDQLELILKLGGVLLLLSLVNSGVRNFLSALGAIAIVFVVLTLLAVIGVFVYQFIKRREGDGEADLEFHEVAIPQQNSSRSVPIHVEAQSMEAFTTATLMEKLRMIDWFQFEKLVALAYEHQGYHVTRRGGANPDGGVDLVIEKDGQQSAVQCKQWKTWNVGVKAVREFLGALTDSGIQRGIFITLNGYTGDAKHLAEKHGIEIINETGLAAMFDGSDIQYDPRVVEILNDTRKFCPKCERLMVERVAGKGPNAGERFWGCSGYPKCKYTMSIS